MAVQGCAGMQAQNRASPRISSVASRPVTPNIAMRPSHSSRLPSNNASSCTAQHRQTDRKPGAMCWDRDTRGRQQVAGEEGGSESDVRHRCADADLHAQMQAEEGSRRR